MDSCECVVTSSSRLTQQSFRLRLIHEQVQVSVDGGDGRPQRRHYGVQPPPAQHRRQRQFLQPQHDDDGDLDSTRSRGQLSTLRDYACPRSDLCALPLTARRFAPLRRSIKPADRAAAPRRPVPGQSVWLHGQPAAARSRSRSRGTSGRHISDLVVLDSGMRNKGAKERGDWRTEQTFQLFHLVWRRREGVVRHRRRGNSHAVCAVSVSLVSGHFGSKTFAEMT